MEKHFLLGAHWEKLGAIRAQTPLQNCHLRFTNRTLKPPQSPSKAEKRRFSQIFWVKVLHGSESRRTFALADGKNGGAREFRETAKVLWKDSINLFVEKYRRLGNSEDELAQGKSLSIPPLINKIRCVRVQRKNKTLDIQWRVWSWLRMNASYRPNTCKSRGSGKEACFLRRRPAHGCVTRIEPTLYSGTALRKQD